MRFFGKKLVQKCNKQGVEGGKKEINKRGGWIFFFKMNKRDSTFIREMRVPVVCTAYTTKAQVF